MSELLYDEAKNLMRLYDEMIERAKIIKTTADNINSEARKRERIDKQVEAMVRKLEEKKQVRKPYSTRTVVKYFVEFEDGKKIEYCTIEKIAEDLKCACSTVFKILGKENFNKKYKCKIGKINKKTT